MSLLLILLKFCLIQLFLQLLSYLSDASQLCVNLNVDVCALLILSSSKNWNNLTVCFLSYVTMTQSCIVEMKVSTEASEQHDSGSEPIIVSWS